eukprot:1354380-Heterocapsa_arctica.AAC.1
MAQDLRSRPVPRRACLPRDPSAAGQHPLHPGRQRGPVLRSLPHRGPWRLQGNVPTLFLPQNDIPEQLDDGNTGY